MHRLFIALAVAAPLTLVACKDPGKDAAKAVTEAPQKSEAPQKAGEVIPFDSKNSKLTFVGSKVTGSHTAEQALRRLLTGTGVAYRFTGANTVTLEVAQVNTAIEVSARATPISSPKYTEPLRELPQTISVIPKSVIQEQGATTLSEVLRNVPGLTIAAGEGGVPAGDNLTMRGFSARNDVFVDGVRDLGPQSR